MDYSVCAWNENHHFSLVDDKLNYRFEKSDVLFTVDLAGGIVSLKRHKQTHRLFRASFVLVLIPPFVLGQVYLKEKDNFSHEPIFFLLYLLVIVGLVMMFRYRTIYNACTVVTKKGDLIQILGDKQKPEEFRRFVGELERIYAGQPK